MTLSPQLRKFTLTAHVTSSVGWLGAVVGFLALSIVGVISKEAQTVRAAYLAMESIGWYVLVPLSLASLVTGVVQALGTRWGLLRHYWIVTKLIINVVASIVLVLYMQTLQSLAGIAADTSSSSDGLRELQSPSPAVHAGLAVVLLVIATVLSVYKPRGLTRYGQRRQPPQQAEPERQRALSQL